MIKKKDWIFARVHPRENGSGNDMENKDWIPAFAGMTMESENNKKIISQKCKERGEI